VSSGKGLTRQAAILSTLFECYERWAAEQPFGRVFVLSRRQIRAWHPDVLVAASETLPIDHEIPWVMGCDLVSGEPCFLPLKKVVFPFPSSFPDASALSSHTSGLAAGAKAIDAIYGAVLEIIERDAVSRLDESHLDLVDLSTAQGPAASLIDSLQSNGIFVSAARCPSPLDIPVFYCLTRDDRWQISSLLCSGSAAHPSEGAALSRALLEVTQSRIGFISTLRDDVGPQVTSQLASSFDVRVASFSPWFSTAASRPLKTQQLETFDSGRDGLSYLLSRIRDVYQGLVIGCARLREAPGLACYRAYCADFHELARA
jgi:YcaO-like protein with predicted kinase domain